MRCFYVDPEGTDRIVAYYAVTDYYAVPVPVHRNYPTRLTLVLSSEGLLRLSAISIIH